MKWFCHNFTLVYILYILIQTLKRHCPFFIQNNSDLHSLTQQNPKKIVHLHSLNPQYALFSRYDSHSLILHCFLLQALSSLKVYIYRRVPKVGGARLLSKLVTSWGAYNRCALTIGLRLLSVGKKELINRTIISRKISFFFNSLTKFYK